MGSYVFFVGGSGSKMLEATLHAAAAGVLRHPGAAIHAVIVDLDQTGGNLKRAESLTTLYQDMRACVSSAQADAEEETDIGFSADFALYRLTAVEEQAMGGILRSTGMGNDREIARALYTDYELEMSYKKGFYGHPNVGAHFFASELPTLPPEHSFSEVIEEIRRELVKGGQPRILLAGSIFGGTGASAIPSIARYIRNLTDENPNPDARRSVGGGAIIGAMLLLPYFATTKGDGVIESSQFEPKAKAALEYYAREGVGYGENKVFNAIYMVGSQDKVVYDYCTGGQEQNNAAHLVDWLGAQAVSHFLTTNPGGYVPQEQDGHYLFNLDLTAPNAEGKTFLTWDSFPDMGMRGGFARLLRAAYVLATSYGYPMVKDLTGKQSLFRTQDAVTRRYFRKVRADEEREEAVLRFRTAGRYFTEFVRWLTEMIVTLPPPYVRSNPGEGYAVGGAGGWRIDVPSNELVDGALLALLYKYYMEMPDGRYDAQKPLGGDASQEDVKSLVCGLAGEYTFEAINRSVVAQTSDSVSGATCFETFLSSLLYACSVQ
ncbi:MAG: hypothetical protein ACOX83_00480 [Candidatus Spyradocola sp.]